MNLEDIDFEAEWKEFRLRLPDDVFYYSFYKGDVDLRSHVDSQSVGMLSEEIFNVFMKLDLIMEIPVLSSFHKGIIL